MSNSRDTSKQPKRNHHQTPNSAESANQNSNSLPSLKLNGALLVSTIDYLEQRSFRKLISSVFKQDRIKYGGYLADDDVTNCNLLLMIIKVHPNIIFQSSPMYPWNEADMYIFFKELFY